MCSTRWDMPVCGGASSREPTRYHTQSEINGVVWISLSNTVIPLGSLVLVYVLGIGRHYTVRLLKVRLRLLLSAAADLVHPPMRALLTYRHTAWRGRVGRGRAQEGSDRVLQAEEC